MARVLVDVPLAHLDRPFDYAVAAADDAAARPGVRVRVRFAGRLVDGVLLERVPASAHPGRLGGLRVVSPEVVAPPELLSLARAVADRWAGTCADVLRLALPARHAAAETDPPPASTRRAGPAPDASAACRGPQPDAPAGTACWAAYPAGEAFLRAVGAGTPARAAWVALPGLAGPPGAPGAADHWQAAVVEAVGRAVAAGRGAVVVVPEARTAEGLGRVLARAGVAHVVLGSSARPRERYRRHLALTRGEVAVAVGTRAAVWAPVTRLGLLVCWDDGDDLLAEPHAPYPHARDVLVLRSQLTGAALLLGGYAMTPESAALCERGWARLVAAPRAAVRRRTPRLLLAGADSERDRDPMAAAARLGSVAFRCARAALAEGAPVLVQVPRAGYQPALACASCRAPARCARCAGPLRRGEAGGVPTCAVCAAPAAGFSCPSCAGTGLRASAVGAERTAEELGRAFPGTPVRRSLAPRVLAEVPGGPALVVATPGGEPRAAGGYGAVLLLDAGVLLARASLRAGGEALRRWLAAAALARPAPAGTVVLTADPRVPAVAALLGWQPAGFARHELGERRQLRFPPAARWAAVEGLPEAVAGLLDALEAPPPLERFGPTVRPARTPGEEPGHRVLLRVPAESGTALAAALKEALARRSARRELGPVRVVLDPAELA